MNILITGYDGVIGKEIANLLIKEKKHKLYLFSKKKLKKVEKQKLYYQDLTKTINHKLIIDIVVHCAAKNPLSKSQVSLGNMYTSNIKMTRNLIKFSNKNKVKKLIFLSAMDVYGQIKNKVIIEDQSKINQNLYGKSKLLSEKLFCNNKNKFKTICIRIPGIFTLDLKRNKPFIVGVVKKIIKNRKVYIYNENSSFNNILDSFEIVRFIKLVLRKKIIKSDVYNFTASDPIKISYVIDLIKKIFKSSSKIISKKSIKNSFTISNQKILDSFNFEISTTKNIIIRCCQKIINSNYKIS